MPSIGAIASISGFALLVPSATICRLSRRRSIYARRPPIRRSDTPGPRKHEPRPGNLHIESVRGHGLGFTSLARRKPEYLSRHRKPEPCTCDPARVDRRIRPRIGLNPLNWHCICYPDERDSSLTPYPGRTACWCFPTAASRPCSSRGVRGIHSPAGGGGLRGSMECLPADEVGLSADRMSEYVCLFTLPHAVACRNQFRSVRAH
jgi:hypothetical protein